MTNRAYLIFDDILRDKTLSSAQCLVPLQYLHWDCMMKNIIRWFVIIYLSVTGSIKVCKENLYWLILKNLAS